MAVLDPLSAFRLDDRVAIVTGASSGLGARFARVLDGAGAKVVLAARREERITATADELDDALAVPCDVAQAADLDALVEATLERFGRIDILVNNAGTVVTKPALEESDDEFDRVLGVNLAGAFRLTRRVAQHMVDADGGSVVNIASMLGTVGVGVLPQTSYAASKGGMVNMTRELAAQWARRGVRVNAIGPGWFHSEMTAEMFDDESGAKWLRRNTPMGRPGDEHELDGALLYLASDASSFVTGQTLLVDGGWTSI